jgi:hypothetical protein
MIPMVFSVNNEDISLERLNGETIILNFKTGAYYSTLGAGSDLFWLVSNKVPRREWVQILETYWSSIPDENNGIKEFIEEAISEGLILESNEGEIKPILLPNDFKRNNWSTPKLLKFNDIQHLLLVDPIHDSSLQGWPNLEENER